MESAPRRCEMKVCRKICFLKIRLEVCVLENQTKRSKAEPHGFGGVKEASPRAVKSLETRGIGRGGD